MGVVEADLNDTIQCANRGADPRIAGGREGNDRGAERPQYPVGDSVREVALPLGRVLVREVMLGGHEVTKAPLSDRIRRDSTNAPG